MLRCLINTGLKQIKMSWKSSYEFKSFESIQNQKIDCSLVFENLFKLKSLSKILSEFKLKGFVLIYQIN